MEQNKISAETSEQNVADELLSKYVRLEATSNELMDEYYKLRDSVDLRPEGKPNLSQLMKFEINCRAIGIVSSDMLSVLHDLNELPGDAVRPNTDGIAISRNRRAMTMLSEIEEKKVAMADRLVQKVCKSTSSDPKIMVTFRDFYNYCKEAAVDHEGYHYPVEGKDASFHISHNKETVILCSEGRQLAAFRFTDKADGYVHIVGTRQGKLAYTYSDYNFAVPIYTPIRNMCWMSRSWDTRAIGKSVAAKHHINVKKFLVAVLTPYVLDKVRSESRYYEAEQFTFEQLRQYAERRSGSKPIKDYDKYHGATNLYWDRENYVAFGHDQTVKILSFPDEILIGTWERNSYKAHAIAFKFVDDEVIISTREVTPNNGDAKRQKSKRLTVSINDVIWKSDWSTMGWEKEVGDHAHTFKGILASLLTHMVCYDECL